MQKRNGKSKGILNKNLMLACNSGPKVRIRGKHLLELACKDWPRVKDPGAYLMLSCLVNKPNVYFSSILTKNEPKKSYGEHVVHIRKRDERKTNLYQVMVKVETNSQSKPYQVMVKKEK